MAITVTEVVTMFGWAPATEIPRNVTVATVTFDSSYPTGGEALAASDFTNISSIDAVVVGSNDEAGVSARWDAANSKLKLMDEDNTSGIEAEFGNGTDASANITTILVIGKSAGI